MRNKNWFKGKILLYLILLLISLTAFSCGLPAIADDSDLVPSPTPTPQPVAALTSAFITNFPAQGMVKQKLRVVSTHADDDGLAKVEFYIDGQLIDTIEYKFPTVQATHEYDWIPETQGKHEILVKAYSERQKASSPSEIKYTIDVGPYVAPTSPVEVAIIDSCLDSSLLGEDITPDGEELQIGQSFEKIWRVINNGTCVWGTDYYLESVIDSPLGASRLYLPQEVRGGESVELSLTMTAPLEPGDYKSHWRLFNEDGEAFGQIFFVQFKVRAQ